MASCSRCNAANADFFSPTGDVVCRVCFNSDQTAQADARARASLEQDAPPGFRAAAPGGPPTSPRSMIAGGVAVMGFAVIFALGTVIFFGSIYPVWVGALLLGGAASVLRGATQLRRS
jgi:hypothetical protein